MSGRAALAGLAVALVVGGAGCGGSGPPPPTARLDRGEVVRAVSAAGSVASSSEQTLGFVAGGRVTQLLVHVGDRVEAGRPLARLDDFQLRRVLDQRQATLDAQEAVLRRVRADPSVAGAEAALAQARRSREATEDEAAATDTANAAATGSARTELRTAQDARDVAEDQRRACGPGCDAAAAESAVQQAESTVASARAGVVEAEQQEKVGRAAGEVSVDDARQVVVSAQNERDAAAGRRPFDIAEQEGVVADARAGVAAARRDVDDAVLSSPVAGVVIEINGAPGEYLPEPTAVTAQAPGSTAAIPGTRSGPGAAGPGSSGPGSSGTAPFIVLAAAGAFQVVVPFEESDAARVAVGQPVDITIDALPGPPLRGRVLAIAPSAQQVDGVVSFYTTISVQDRPDRLRDGMTARAAVRAESRDNVLRVPNAAVGRTGGRPSVTVLDADGDPQQVPFDAGLVGDDFTEVRSGLAVGQQIVLPQARVDSTAERGPRRRGG